MLDIDLYKFSDFDAVMFDIETNIALFQFGLTGEIINHVSFKYIWIASVQFFKQDVNTFSTLSELLPCVFVCIK